MSYQQFFNECAAVAQILEDYHREDDVDQTEVNTAIWQAAELLARAQTVLFPLVSLDVAKAALLLPDPVLVADEQ